VLLEFLPGDRVTRRADYRLWAESAARRDAHRPIKVTQRIIVNFFTAKRLLAALSMSVQRHESVFGVLETDINKRLRIQQSR
jgi:hypothetical protein